MKPKVLIIYTGGTIGMIQSKERILVPFSVESILKNVPELNQINCKIETVSFEDPVDSSDFNIYYYQKLIDLVEEHYYTHDGFVVLHGTDTMSFTSSALSFMIENLKKPIVFTGSQLPIGHLRTDAKENLITSVLVAADQTNKQSTIQEVCLYFEFNLYRANRTSKISAEQFNAYVSPNFPVLGESGVNFKIEHRLLLKSIENQPTVFHRELSNDVAVLKIYPGINPNYVKSVLNTPDIKGLIIETFGAGNATTQEWFLDLLSSKIKEGIHIVNVTQCIYGRVEQGKYATSLALKNRGVVSAKDMTFEAALTKMMCLLKSNLTLQQFKNNFKKPLSGEISVF